VSKRILVVTPWKRRWEMGGTAGLADDHYFISGFTGSGYEVHYVSPRYDGPTDVPVENYFVHDFPNVLDATERWPSFLRRPLWPVLFTAQAVRRAMRVARRSPPCFVLGQTHLSAPAVRILAGRLRVPSAVKLFGVEDLDRTDWPRARYLRKNLEQILAFKVRQDAWIILDDGTGGVDAARRHGVSPERIRSLPNGVNLEWLRRAPDPHALRSYGVPAGAAVVLFLSRLTAWKRPDLFIRAAPRIIEKSRRAVQFLIAGDGPMRADCEALVARLGLASAVRFLGPLPHERVPDLLSATTVLASTNQRSSAGIPTCEGVPVVAFDVGATRRVIHDRETGRLVPEGDLEAFAGAAAELLDDEEMRSSMGRRARAFAAESFTAWPDRVRMEVDIVEGLVSARTG
jgi:glycosyltransferase involved in cell wall biosynthesis